LANGTVMSFTVSLTPASTKDLEKSKSLSIFSYGTPNSF
jgi:hypothetical protein